MGVQSSMLSMIGSANDMIGEFSSIKVDPQTDTDLKVRQAALARVQSIKDAKKGIIQSSLGPIDVNSPLAQKIAEQLQKENN